MDALQELEAKIEELIVVAERAREEELDRIIEMSATYDDALDGASRAEIAAAAVAYAGWVTATEGYRSLLRGARGRLSIAP